MESSSVASSSKCLPQWERKQCIQASIALIFLVGALIATYYCLPLIGPAAYAIPAAGFILSLIILPKSCPSKRKEAHPTNLITIPIITKELVEKERIFFQIHNILFANNELILPQGWIIYGNDGTANTYMQLICDSKEKAQFCLLARLKGEGAIYTLVTEKLEEYTDGFKWHRGRIFKFAPEAS